MSPPSPLPPSWRDTFFGEADLETSYRGLDGRRHFFASTMRGHIRALQLRFRDAWDHFDLAAGQAEEMEESIPNLVRRFLLEIYRFETAVVENPVSPTTEFLPFEMPEVRPAILEYYPEVKYVLDLRRACEGKLLLHVGRCEEAAEIYESLIAENPNGAPDALGMYYLNLAACQHGLGQFGDVQRNLENAGLATAAVDGALNACQLSATLHAFYRFLDDHCPADDWKRFLLRLRCPEDTQRIFIERARLLMDRCFAHSRLVAF